MKKIFLFTLCINFLNIVASELTTKKEQEKIEINESQCQEFKNWYKDNVDNISKKHKKELVLKIKTLINNLNKLHSNLEVARPCDLNSVMASYGRSNKNNENCSSDVTKKVLKKFDNLVIKIFPIFFEHMEYYKKHSKLASEELSSEDTIQLLNLLLQRECFKKTYPILLITFETCLKLCEW